MTISENLSVALRFRIKEARTTQRDLARKVGVSEKHLSQILTGRSGATTALWDRLFDALDGSADD